MSNTEVRVNDVDGDRVGAWRFEMNDWATQSDVAVYVRIPQSRVCNIEWNRANKRNSLPVSEAARWARFLARDIWEMRTDEALIVGYMDKPGVQDLPRDVARRFAAALVAEDRSVAAANRALLAFVNDPASFAEASRVSRCESEGHLRDALDLDDMYRAAALAAGCRPER